MALHCCKVSSRCRSHIFVFSRSLLYSSSLLSNRGERFALASDEVFLLARPYGQRDFCAMPYVWCTERARSERDARIAEALKVLNGVHYPDRGLQSEVDRLLRLPLLRGWSGETWAGHQGECDPCASENDFTIFPATFRTVCCRMACRGGSQSAVSNL